MNFAPFKNAGPVDQSATLTDILAAARAHRIDMTSCVIQTTGDLRGQDETLDRVHVLARLVASPSCGMIEVASLAGSFNPQVAQQLMVGKIR